MRKEVGLEQELKALLLCVPTIRGWLQVEVEGLPTPTRYPSQARAPISFQAFSVPTVSWSLIPKQDLWADHLCALAWSQSEAIESEAFWFPRVVWRTELPQKEAGQSREMDTDWGAAEGALGDACLWSNKLGFNHLFSVGFLFVVCFVLRQGFSV